MQNNKVVGKVGMYALVAPMKVVIVDVLAPSTDKR